MRVRVGTAAGLLLVSAGCNGATSDLPDRHQGATWFQRLELSPEDGTAVDARKRVVYGFTPPAEIAPWRVETDGEVRIGPIPTFAGQGVDVLHVYGTTTKRVVIPGPFDPAAFNRVDVTVLVRARAPLTVSGLRGGQEVVRSDSVWLPGADSPIRMSVPLGGNRFESEAYDELAIAVGKEGGPAFFAAVDLTWQDYGAWLPAAGGEPGLVKIGEESRQAVGLASERPLVCRVPRTPGSRLGFSFGAPAGFVGDRRRPALELSLRDAAGHELISRHSLPAGTWSYVEVDLDALAGSSREVEARFALRVEGEGPAVCALGEVQVVKRARAPPPTVLLVTSDTHRADHVGAAGLGVALETPSMDALAARGVLFENGWSASNVTIPSHVALLTGVHPRDTHIVDNRTGVASSAPTLAEAFRDHGYATFAVVSTRHLSHGISGLGQGFDRMAAPQAIARGAASSVDLLGGWLDEAAGRPLFVWLHLFDAHGPYTPPDELAARYVRAGMSDGDRQRALYRGEIGFVDRQLGRVLRHPRMAHAVIAFSADHGESLGAHGIRFAHRELYPDTVHVPLILAWPGAPAGARPAATARQMHLGRTLLDLAGLAHVAFPGRSLLLYLDEAHADAHADAHDPGPVFAVSAEGSSASITHAGWHLILHLYEHHALPGKEGRLYRRHETELFHRALDHACERDVVATEPAQARRLRGILASWLAAASDPGWATQANLDPDELRDLERLGYVAGKRRAVADEWIDPDCTCDTCVPFQ